MFTLHLIMQLPSRKKASHTIQHGSMAINYTVELTVYCDTCAELSRTRLQTFNKEVREYAKINISNKSPKELNKFVYNSNRSNICHIQVCQAQFTYTYVQTVSQQLLFLRSNFIIIDTERWIRQLQKVYKNRKPPKEPAYNYLEFLNTFKQHDMIEGKLKRLLCNYLTY